MAAPAPKPSRLDIDVERLLESRRMRMIAEVYLDETLSEMDRGIRIMRILKHAYESEMTETRLKKDLHIPARFLTENGEVLENEWLEYNNK